MNPCAKAEIATRPTAAIPSLIFGDPCSAKNQTTLAAFWLHQAAVYLAPNAVSFVESMRVLSDLQAVTTTRSKDRSLGRGATAHLQRAGFIWLLQIAYACRHRDDVTDCCEADPMVLIGRSESAGRQRTLRSRATARETTCVSQRAVNKRPLNDCRIHACRCSADAAAKLRSGQESDSSGILDCDSWITKCSGLE